MQERDRGEIECAAQVGGMPWRAAHRARLRRARVFTTGWLYQARLGSLRVDHGATRFRLFFSCNLGCAPEAATSAFRGPVQPPSSENFSRARAMRTCASRGVQVVYMRMRLDTRADLTTEEPPEPPNPSNAAHITPRLPQPRPPAAYPASRGSAWYHFGPRGKPWGGPVARAGLKSTKSVNFREKSRFDEI